VSSILIVDDAAVDRVLIQRLLERAEQNWQIQSVADAAAAMELIQSEPIDAVVTDLQMPRIDGLAQRPHLPVVLVTGMGSEQAAMDALRSGAASYSPKSQLARDLAATVAYVLEIAARVQNRPLNQACPECTAFVLENEARLIMPLIDHLQAQLPHWSDSSRLQIGMALNEALTNAMHHGNLEVPSTLRVDDESDYYFLIRQRQKSLPYCDRRVRVQFETSPEQIQIEISDEGPGFNPEAVPDPRSPANLEKLSGRGLLLIRTFMDEVRFADKGSRIVMIKHREKKA
jgi:CheY-like chemotaxis protein/anti-sigma regulatory factor (Ser/Thr protein kinase)